MDVWENINPIDGFPLAGSDMRDREGGREAELQGTNCLGGCLLAILHSTMVSAGFSAGFSAPPVTASRN